MKAKFAIPFLLLSVCFFTGCPATDPYAIKLHTDATPGNISFTVSPPPPGATYYLNVIRTGSDGSIMSIIYENYFTSTTPPALLRGNVPVPEASEYVQIFGSYSMGPATSTFFNADPPSPPPAGTTNFSLRKSDGTAGVTITTMGLMP